MLADLMVSPVYPWPDAARRAARWRPRLLPPLALVASLHPERARMASQALRRMGFRILTAGPAAEAEDLPLRAGGPVDLLAVDIEAGEREVDRLRALRETCPALRVLYISPGDDGAAELVGDLRP